MVEIVETLLKMKPEVFESFDYLAFRNFLNQCAEYVDL